MPYDKPDPEDPNVLVGVELPGSLGELRSMACVFADEFARMGYSEQAIMDLFRSPFYAGAHRAWLALGEGEVGAIAAESARAWGAGRMSVLDAPRAGESRRRLPVVD